MVVTQRPFGVSLLLSWFVAFPVSAADEPVTQAEPLEMVVVTATRRALGADELTAAITVIEGQEAVRRGIDVLPEAVRGTPGAFFQQTTPGQGTPIIRGLKGSQVLHLVDGMRINNAFFRDAPNQYVALVDSFILDRAEVVRGAAGSLHGADAMGGVVALSTRTQQFDGPQSEQRYRLYGGFNSADNGWQARAEAATGNQHGSLAAGISWLDRGHRRTGDGTTVRPTAYEARAGDLRWVATPTPDREWMFQAQVLEQPDTPRIDELVPGFGQETPSSSEYRFIPNRRSFLHGRYRASLPYDWLTELRLDLARQVIVDDRETRDYDSPVRLSEQNESTMDGFTVQGRSRPLQAVDVVWGLELYRDDVRSARQAEDLVTGERRDTRARFPNGAYLDSDALYAQINWALSRGVVEAGLRYSQFDIFLPGPNNEPAARLKPDDLTGDVRLQFDVAPGVRFVTNLGRGFRPPNVFDLGAVGPRPGNRFNNANPDLGPETVWSVDFGIKTESGRLRTELFAFFLDYQDKITSVPTGELTESGRVIVRSENRSEARIRGIEAALDWQLSNDLLLALRLNATHGDEKDEDGSTTPGDRIPPLNGRVALTWRPVPNWRIDPFVDFADRQDRLSPRDVADPRIDPNGTAGWATVNIHVQWQARPGLMLGLRLDNLLDKAYREHGSGIDAPGLNLGLWADATF